MTEGSGDHEVEKLQSYSKLEDQLSGEDHLLLLKDNCQIVEELEPEKLDISNNAPKREPSAKLSGATIEKLIQSIEKLLLSEDDVSIEKGLSILPKIIESLDYDDTTIADSEIPTIIRDWLEDQSAITFIEYQIELVANYLLAILKFKKIAKIYVEDDTIFTLFFELLKNCEDDDFFLIIAQLFIGYSEFFEIQQLIGTHNGIQLFVNKIHSENTPLRINAFLAISLFLENKVIQNQFLELNQIKTFIRLIISNSTEHPLVQFNVFIAFAFLYNHPALCNILVKIPIFKRLLEMLNSSNPSNILITV